MTKLSEQRIRYCLVLQTPETQSSFHAIAKMNRDEVLPTSPISLTRHVSSRGQLHQKNVDKGDFAKAGSAMAAHDAESFWTDSSTVGTGSEGGLAAMTSSSADYEADSFSDTVLCLLGLSGDELAAFRPDSETGGSKISQSISEMGAAPAEKRHFGGHAADEMPADGIGKSRVRVEDMDKRKKNFEAAATSKRKKKEDVASPSPDSTAMVSISKSRRYSRRHEASMLVSVASIMFLFKRGLREQAKPAKSLNGGRKTGLMGKISRSCVEEILHRLAKVLGIGNPDEFSAEFRSMLENIKYVSLRAISMPSALRGS